MYAAAPSGVLCEPTAYDPAAASKLQELSQVAYEEQLPRLQGWLQMLVRVRPHTASMSLAPASEAAQQLSGACHHCIIVLYPAT